MPCVNSLLLTYPEGITSSNESSYESSKYTREHPEQFKIGWPASIVSPNATYFKDSWERTVRTTAGTTERTREQERSQQEEAAAAHLTPTYFQMESVLDSLPNTDRRRQLRGHYERVIEERLPSLMLDELSEAERLDEDVLSDRENTFSYMNRLLDYALESYAGDTANKEEQRSSNGEQPPRHGEASGVNCLQLSKDGASGSCR